MKKLTIICLFLTVLFSSNAFSKESYTFERMWPMMEGQWYFKEPSGIAIDSEGFVYIADSQNNCVHKLTSDGRVVSKWGRLGKENGDFNQPQGIAVDSNNFIYVVDSQNNRIQKFKSDGQFVMSFGSWGSENGQFKLPYGIAISMNGDLYVTELQNNRIQRFKTDGRFMNKWGLQGKGNGEFFWPYGIAIDRDGYVYVTDARNNRVQKFDSKGNFIDTFGTYGTKDKEFDWPLDIAIDDKGAIYVSELKNHRIQKFNKDGSIEKWGSFGSGNGQFNTPDGIAISSNGYMYIADSRNDRIQKFTHSGVFVSKWGRGGENKDFASPDGIAIAKNGDIYVADSGNDSIKKFNANREFLKVFDGKFYSPYRITIDYEGNVYVADSGHDQIQKFDAEGNFLLKWGGYGTGNSQFSRPYGIATDSIGNVYVADQGNYRIQKFDKTGKYLIQFGVKGSEPGQFDQPEGIGIDSNDNIYVADTQNHRVQKFDKDLKFVIEWGTKGSGNGQFDLPNAVTIDADGNVYVSDMKNCRVQKFGFINGKPEMLSIFGEEGSYPGQMKYPGDIAIDADGKLYIADNNNHRIEIFKKKADEKLSKAIIVAGGGPYSGNKLWDSTRIAANFAYQVLNYQGIGKENIRYFSEDNADLDNNGKADDITGIPTAKNLEDAISWAKDADTLVLYITDHGGKETFRMSVSENLNVSDLAKWLNQSQSEKSKDIIFVYDACNSGTFLAPLSGVSSPRILMTSTEGAQDAYFIAQGMVSFSGFFWTEIFRGSTVKSAFDSAQNSVKDIVKVQIPAVKNNGIPPEKTIGNGTERKGDMPVIENIPDSAKIRVRITDADGVGRVWAVMKPVNSVQTGTGSTVTDLPSADLLPIGNGEYSTDYNSFGSGEMVIYARDNLGNTSVMPVISGSSLRRKAIIVSGTGTSALKNADAACNALKLQWYSDTDIIFLVPPDSQISCKKPDSEANSANLKNALANMLNTQDVTLYMTGAGSSGYFRINSKENLPVSSLKQWFDALQIPGKVVVIYDADYSASFTASAAGKDRIFIASADQMAFFGDNISFSAFFWNSVGNGAGVKKAFTDAKNALGFLSSAIPQITDSGSIAASYYIGNGIKMADAVAITPDITLAGQTSSPIWLEDTAGNIVQAYAMITKPCINDLSCNAEKLVLALKDGRYEGTYNKFGNFGTYHVSLYGMDKNGNMLVSKDMTVFQSVGDDIYESDNSLYSAKNITINDAAPQEHNFFRAGDEDWIKFYGLAGQTYTIRAGRLGKDCYPVIELRDINYNILKTWKTSTLHEDIAQEWKCVYDGVYYLRIYNEKTGQDTGYNFEIYTPTAAFAGYVSGSITDESGNPVGDAQIKTDANGSALSYSDGMYLINQPAGSQITVTVAVPGYYPTTQTISVPESGTASLNFRLTPITSYDSWYEPPSYQPTPEDRGSIAVREDLTLNICARYRGLTFSLTMNFAPNPHGLNGVFWNADPATLKLIQSSSPACIDVGDDLKMNIRAEYRGIGYTFPMSFYPYPNAASASEFFWKADPASLRVIY